MKNKDDFINNGYDLEKFDLSLGYDRYAAWRKIAFSDVDNFDPDNYIFLTHSVRLRNKNSEYYNFSAGTKPSGAFYGGTENFDIAFNPFDLCKKTRVSLALSSSKDNYTYGRVGFIVSAPIENILCVGQASFFSSNDELRKKKLLTPEDALADSFHEVVFEGRTMYGSVMPIAIFVNLTDANETEIINTLFELEQITNATGNCFPVLDLSSKDYRLDKVGKKSLL